MQSNNTNASETTTATDEFTSCEVFYFVVSGVLGSVTILVGFVGNGLAFLVLHKLDRSSVIFFILKALAVVDTVFLVTYGVVRVVAHTLDSLSLPGAYGRFQYLVYALFPVLSMAWTLTLGLTCLLTVHRYIGLCRVFNASRWSNMATVRVHVGVMAAVSALLEIVRFFDYEIQAHVYQGQTYYIMQPTDLFYNDHYQLWYRMVLMNVMRKVVPLVVATVLTSCLVKKLSKLSRDKMRFFPAHNHPEERTGTKSYGVTRTLILISVLTIVLHTPAAIYPFISVCLGDIPSDPCAHFYHYFTTCAEALAALNSALNFYIYYPSMPTLRAQLSTMISNTLRLRHIVDNNNRVSVVSRKLSVRAIDVAN